MKRFFVFLLILTILLCGCAEKTKVTTTVTTTTPAKIETEKIIIVDQIGREVEIPKKVERIVSLWPEATRVLFALGVGDKIVGLDSNSKKCPILTRAFPEVKDLPDLGSPARGTLNLEKLAELKPDIVFMRTEDIELANKIQNTFGIPVVCVRMNPPPDRNTSLEIISVIGKCVGKEERAKEIRDYLEQKLSMVTSVTSKISDEEKPKVYPANPYDLLKVIARADDVILAGGKCLANVKRESWSYTVSFEDVAKWNPDVILLHAVGRFMPEDLEKDPNWKQIKAVKEGRVYRILFGYLGKDPGLFVINVLTDAKIFHPDKFNYDVEKEGNEIFKKLYGVDGLYTKLKEDYKLSDV
jgi:iron complex transport system substrate-binding protein